MADTPRLIGRKEAAEYCGISPTCFSIWVASHKMPPAIPGTRKWDKRAIDAKLDEISGLSVNSNKAKSGLSEWRRRRDDRRGAEPIEPLEPLSNYDAWYQAKLKRREKYRPQLDLDAKQERVLHFMADHPECDTIDVIPGAGPTAMDKLIEAGAVRLVDTAGKVLRYGVTDEGQAELHRFKKWKALTP